MAQKGASVTTGQSASLAVHGEVKRGHINAAPKAPPHRGGEAPAPRPELFTSGGPSLRPFCNCRFELSFSMKYSKLCRRHPCLLAASET